MYKWRNKDNKRTTTQMPVRFFHDAHIHAWMGAMDNLYTKVPAHKWTPGEVEMFDAYCTFIRKQIIDARREGQVRNA